MNDTGDRCGYVTLAGRANVGKSTLLNRLIGHKVSITSRRPQTTRMRLLGIKTTRHCQIIFVDTPGIQKGAGNVFHRFMNREARAALADVDVVVHVVEAGSWNDADAHVHTLVKKTGAPAILAINKVDLVKNKSTLLPYMERIQTRNGYREIVPVSARTGINLAVLEQCIKALLPVGPALFPDDQISDKNERYFAGEFIREKLFRSLGHELPYNLSVVIEEFRDTGKMIKIDAIIWVEKEGQKKIVIGADGNLLKKIGAQARQDMEKLFGKKVFLQTWVRVKHNWPRDEKFLRLLGYSRHAQ